MAERGHSSIVGPPTGRPKRLQVATILNFLSGQNSRQKERTLCAMSVLLLVGFCLALAPEASSLADISNHPCPDCVSPEPVAMADDDRASHRHETSRGGTPCEMAGAECCITGSTVHGAQIAHQRPKDALDHPPAAPVASYTSLTAPRTVAATRECLFKRPFPGSPCPLHIFYCVYLD